MTSDLEEGPHEPRLTAAMDEAGDLLSAPLLTHYTRRPAPIYIFDLIKHLRPVL